MGSAVSDVFITCCTFGVLILLLRCLPLAESASFTVTAFRGKKTRQVHLYMSLPIDGWFTAHYQFVFQYVYILLYKIPVVASPDWVCSPLPELPVCTSLCRFLHPESPRCPREQPWEPRFPFPLAPLRPGKESEEMYKDKHQTDYLSNIQKAVLVRYIE